MWETILPPESLIYGDLAGKMGDCLGECILLYSNIPEPRACVVHLSSMYSLPNAYTGRHHRLYHTDGGLEARIRRCIPLSSNIQSTIESISQLPFQDT